MLIDTCAHFNVNAVRTEHTGVWVGNDKIAALGELAYDSIILLIGLRLQA